MLTESVHQVSCCTKIFVFTVSHCGAVFLLQEEIHYTVMFFLGILIFVLNLSLGFVTFYQKRTLEAKIFSTFAVGFGVWAFSVYRTIETSSLFWGRTAFAGAITGIGSIFLFSLIFPGNKAISKKILFFISLPTVLLLVATYTNLMITSVKVLNGAISGTFGPLMKLYQFFAPIYIFGSLFVIFKKYKKAYREEKIKIMYAFIGISLFVGPAVITNAVLPLWFNIYSLNTIGPIFSICMVSFISYAIIRHQFLDIKIIIQRGLVYSVLFSFIVILYISTLFTVEHLLPIDHDRTLLLVSIITTAFGIFTVPYLNRLLEKVTDPIFFKGRYNYADTVALLTKTLNDTISLTSIVKKTTSILKEKLKVSEVIFDLSQDKEKKI